MYHQREIVAAQTGVYYPAFDYLRIVLATAVAAGHVGLLTWEQSGNFSVQIFFALSGWLIGGILLRSTPANLPRFYFNRSARIWVPYLVAVAVLVAVSATRDVITPKWIEFVTYDVTFVYNLFGPPQLAAFLNSMPLQGTGNHFWSICSEEQFYLIAPLVITALPIGRSILCWLIIFVALMLTPLWGYFASIALGVVAVLIKDKYGSWHQDRMFILALSALAAIAFILIYFDTIPYHIGAPIAAISTVLALAQPGPQSKVAEFLGGVSYPMYLNHWIGAFAANAIFAKLGMRGSLAADLASLLIAFLVAAVLYVTIDRNIRVYRDRVFTPARGKLLAAIGYALVSVGLIFGLTEFIYA